MKDDTTATIAAGTTVANLFNPINWIYNTLGGFSANRAVNAVTTHGSYSDLQAYKKANDIRVSDRDLVNTLIGFGKIDTKEYGAAIKAIQDYSDAYEKSDAAGKYTFAEWLEGQKHMAKTSRKVEELYRMVRAELPKWYDDDVNFKERLDGIVANSPRVPYAPAPNLFDLSDYEPVDLPVDPVRMWTGQELANLHGIDYNFDNYYDLMKQGSRAQVALKEYENAQANVLGALQDEDTRVSYLDAIRNNRTRAMNRGISAGQRAANELLSMQDAMNQYSTNQSGIVDNQMSNIEPSINNDAYIKRTAQEFYQNLVHNMGGLSNGLYTIDNNRYGSDVTSAADIYASSLGTRGQALMANAAMQGKQQEANAQIAAVNQGLQDQNNLFRWIYDNELVANGGNQSLAKNAFLNYLQTGYTNSDLTDYYNNLIANGK